MANDDVPYRHWTRHVRWPGPAFWERVIGWQPLRGLERFVYRSTLEDTTIDPWPPIQFAPMDLQLWRGLKKMRTKKERTDDA